MSRSEHLELSGTSVLIVEDEYFLANELAKTLRAAGAEVIGPASSAAAAERLLDGQTPNCALIDMNLRGAVGASLADRLAADGVRFGVLSGYDRASLPMEVRDVPYLEKPATPEAVTAMVAALARAPA